MPGRDYLAGAGSVLLIVGIIWFVFYRRRHHASSVTISLPFGLGSVTYENSVQDRVLAWRMYVQLKTRKAALPFDEKCDLIADVYASLYDLFGVTRELLSSTPLSDVQRPNGVWELILRVLNDGIRPHLTRWQASFRCWWDQQLKDTRNEGVEPQELQREYPRYHELVVDLERTNTELSKFAEELLLIARTNWKTAKTKAKAIKLPQPAPPSRSTQLDAETSLKTATEEGEIPQPTTPYVSAVASPSDSRAQGREP